MSGAPLSLTLNIWQGQTFDESLTLQDSAGTITDLTGYTAKMMARQNINDEQPQITWTNTTGEIVLGGTAGTIAFNISATATAALHTSNEITVWQYDLVITAPSGVAERVVQGALVVYPGVTR